MRVQKGFGATEYIVGIAFMAIMLLLPFSDGESVIEMLSEGVKSHHSGYIYAQSMSHMQVGVGD